MHTVSEIITPQRAQELLKTNPRNRTINKSFVDMLTKNILNGQYEETHQSIAISKDGVLIDGHHRLTAVANANIPVRMQVTYDANNSTKIDVGYKRNQRDQGYMNGFYEKTSIEYNGLTYPLITFAYERNFGQAKARMLSVDDKHALYLDHKEQIDMVIKIATSGKSKGKGRSGAVLYAMMCALNNGIEFDTLKKWFAIVTTGDFYMEDDELTTRAGRSVLLFKNYLEFLHRGGGFGSGQYLIKEVVKKAMSSIYNYSKKNCITKLYGSLYFDEITMTERM